MHGAELAMERSRALGLLQSRYGGAGDDAPYWDLDYVIRLVRGGATYQPHRKDANRLIAWALIRLGADRAQVLAGYDLTSEDVDSIRLERLMLTNEQRAAAVAQVEKDWPDTSGLGQSVAQGGDGYKGIR